TPIESGTPVAKPASGGTYCKGCGKQIKTDAKFCASCGTAVEKDLSAPAFEEIGQNPVNEPIVYVEPIKVFANGLPEWNLEPPELVQRRRTQK
ncbi:MAG: zinc ribbon domain-containing protein, partial [Clostridiales bacterium]|nr:zinc ribbon domain-containing protein [Clostridiales bacterium]